MATDAVQGRLAQLLVDDTLGAGPQNVGGIVDTGINIEVDSLECTSHDSNGAREFLPGHHTGTVDAGGRWLDPDPGLDIILDAIPAKTRYDFDYRQEVAVGKRVFTGKGFATSDNPSGPLDDVGGYDITLQCSGLTFGIQ